MAKTMHTTARFLFAGLLLGALAPLQALQAPAPSPAGEQFRYRWTLGNFVGTLASVFLPHQGVGELTFEPQKNGRLRTELLITSPSSKAGEYWRYGAEIDPASRQTLRAWSSYLWRGEHKSKSEDIGTNGVFDVVSGIYEIRRDPPVRSRKMEIWSDGKIYPVLVIPLKPERKRLGNQVVSARHYTIRGIDAPGDGDRRWKGKLDLWLATDPASTPVEIMISRNLADVRLVLVSSSTS
jgi:hypothetical protein